MLDEQPAQLDVVVEAFELMLAQRLCPDARDCGDRRGRHDLARRGDLRGTRGEVDDRAEDVAVAQQHVARRDAGTHRRDDRMLGEGRGQAQGDRAGGTSSLAV